VLDLDSVLVVGGPGPVFRQCDNAANTPVGGSSAPCELDFFPGLFANAAGDSIEVGAIRERPTPPAQSPVDEHAARVAADAESQVPDTSASAGSGRLLLSG
jgi:hypothetical protein